MYKVINSNFFNDVWFDFRVAIYSKYMFGNFTICDEYLTYYRQSSNNVSSNFPKFSLNWWLRRHQYHKYLNKFLDINNLNYNKYNIDYVITNMMIKFLNYKKKYEINIKK